MHSQGLPTTTWILCNRDVCRTPIESPTYDATPFLKMALLSMIRTVADTPKESLDGGPSPCVSSSESVMEWNSASASLPAEFPSPRLVEEEWRDQLRLPFKEFQVPAPFNVPLLRAVWPGILKGGCWWTDRSRAPK